MVTEKAFLTRIYADYTRIYADGLGDEICDNLRYICENPRLGIVF